MRQVNGPKEYEKKKKYTDTIRKSIKKEIKKIKDLQRDIDTIKATNPNSFWESMSSNIKPVPLLNAIMKLFKLPNDMMVDETKKKKRNMRGHEK